MAAMSTASVVPVDSRTSLQLSVRAGAAAGIGVAVAELLGLKYPIYVLVTAVIVTDLNPARTRALAPPRIAGTVIGAAMHAGARDVITIPEPMAAAIGVGLPIDEPAANMIVDIGGGTTEIAIISLNGIVFSKSIRVAGDELDTAVINYMKRAYNLLIGERTAEEIKMRVGSAYPLDEELSMEVKGRDSVAGLPKTIHVTSQEIREALADTIASIVDAVRVTLERCPPELSADLVDRGFVMAGGGALIRGIDKLLSEKTGLPVTVIDDPLSAVANGTGAVLNDLSWLMQNV